jgi:hypothetical protein
MIVFLFSFALIAWLPSPANTLRMLFLDISAPAETHTADENKAQACVRDHRNDCLHIN